MVEIACRRSCLTIVLLTPQSAESHRQMVVDGGASGGVLQVGFTVDEADAVLHHQPGQLVPSIRMSRCGMRSA